jgi:hypothetical protein
MKPRRSDPPATLSENPADAWVGLPMGSHSRAPEVDSKWDLPVRCRFRNSIRRRDGCKRLSQELLTDRAIGRCHHSATMNALPDELPVRVAMLPDGLYPVRNDRG